MSQHTSPFADQLTIDTPEQVMLELPLASAGSRLLAILTDSLIQGAGALALTFLFFLIFSAAPALQTATRVMSWNQAAQKWFVAGLILLVFLVFWGYFSLFEAFWNGQTPGKRLLKIRVLADSGRPITLFEALARNLLRVIDMQPSIYLVGLVTMLCNRQGKRLGDLLAGTLVVHESGTHGEPGWADTQRILSLQAAPVFTPATSLVDPAKRTGEIPADAVARLGPADLRVLETFFARHLDLSLEVRALTAGRVAAQMTERMGWAPPDAAEYPERLLERLLAAMRDH